MSEMASAANRMEAPGASASRTCGIIALVAGILLGPFCIGIPIALTLGIVAIVKANQAKRLAAQFPDQYLPPSSAGLVMGILGIALPALLLPFIGIISAIAVPAVLGQRARARDKAAIENLQVHFSDLVGRYDALKEAHKTDAEIKAGLEAYLQESGRGQRNPWNVAQPAFSYSIAVVEGITPETTGASFATPSNDLGQGVYVIQFKSKDHPGFLAGSTITQNSVGGSKVIFRKTEIE
jgi:type II secretory pathway pseudopilin PulG